MKRQTIDSICLVGLGGLRMREVIADIVIQDKTRECAYIQHKFKRVTVLITLSQSPETG